MIIIVINHPIFLIVTKVDCSRKRPWVLRKISEFVKFHEAPHVSSFPIIYGVPHEILWVFINVLDESGFQNPKIFRRTDARAPNNLL
jgi:hypothetical protein